MTPNYPGRDQLGQPTPRTPAAAATVRRALDHQAERIDAIEAQLARLADALDPEGTDPAAWPMLQLPPVVAAIVAEWADTNRGTWPAPDPAAALDLVDEPHRSDYGARIIEAARAALGLAVNDGPAPSSRAAAEHERIAAAMIEHEARADRLAARLMAVLAQEYGAEHHHAAAVARGRIAAWLQGEPLDVSPHPWPEPIGAAQTAERDAQAAALAALLSDVTEAAREVAAELDAERAQVAGALDADRLRVTS